jgi:hypothetical protein
LFSFAAAAFLHRVAAHVDVMQLNLQSFSENRGPGTPNSHDRTALSPARSSPQPSDAFSHGPQPFRIHQAQGLGADHRDIGPALKKFDVALGLLERGGQFVEGSHKNLREIGAAKV